MRSRTSPRGSISTTRRPLLSLRIPIGAEVIPQAINGTAKLQLATSSTVFPAFMQTFTLQGMTFIITEIGKAYQQGGYVYANITFRQKFN